MMDVQILFAGHQDHMLGCTNSKRLRATLTELVRTLDWYAVCLLGFDVLQGFDDMQVGEKPVP